MSKKRWVAVIVLAIGAVIIAVEMLDPTNVAKRAASRAVMERLSNDSRAKVEWTSARGVGSEVRIVCGEVSAPATGRNRRFTWSPFTKLVHLDVEMRDSETFNTHWQHMCQS